MGRFYFNKRCATLFCAPILVAITTICVNPTPINANAVMGTYAQPNVLVADGTTIYTAWVFADNTGLNGELTWGTQHDFFLPPYATLIPGGLGVAFGKPDPTRDFFEGKPMIFETFSSTGAATGRLVNQADQVSNGFGDLQFFRFTVNTNAPTGTGNFDLGPSTSLTDTAGSPQPLTKQNIQFALTTRQGDLNLDGFVGIEDLNTVLGNWNASTPAPNFPTGDTNGDRFVGIEDLNWVLSNWNAGTPPSPPAAVPEPATATLYAAACITTLRRSRTSATLR